MSIWIVAIVVTSNALFGCQETEKEPTGPPKPVQALLTDSFVVQIDHPPEVVWAHLKRLYVKGDRYRQRGLEVSPITNDPTAFLGGLHAVSKPDAAEGEIELRVRFSIIDDENKFMAMHMDGLLPRGIYISHDVSPVGEGSRYQVIIHAFMEVENNDNKPPTAESVREWMTARLAGHNQGLKATVMKEIVEALDSAEK